MNNNNITKLVMLYIDINKNFLKNDFNNDIYNGLLWHYTTIDGLDGILTSEKDYLKFWFTRSDCLNDRSEGLYILELYNQVLTELYNEKIINKQLHNFCKQINLSKNTYVSFPLPPDDSGASNLRLDFLECDAFICCFSTKKDSLDMWRYYSNAFDGYALGFNKCILFDDYKKFSFSHYKENVAFAKLESFKVIYSNDEKKQILKKCIKKALLLYEKEEIEKDHLKKYIEYIFQNFRFRFKHECFSSENEYRYVFYRPKIRPKEMVQELPKIQYRVRNGVMIPYIELKEPKNSLYEIQISPYIIDDFAIDTLNSYLVDNKISVKPSKSDLPVRF